MTNGLRFLTCASLLLGGCASLPPPTPPSAAGTTVIPYAEPLNNSVELPRGPIEATVAEALQLIQRRDPDLNAVIRLNPRAMAEAQVLDRSGAARDLLYGKPILIKDNVEVAGLPTTAGSLALANNNTGRDSPLVARLREAGAVILGKTNLSEWANIR